MNDKQPTSGFVSDIGDESDFNSTRHNGGFTNISEAYVSKSGFNPNRSLENDKKLFLMTAIRKTALYMLDS